MTDYFDEPMVNRQRLLWAIATRQQLERWEPFVARWVLDLTYDREPAGADIWAAEIEHHFLLVAARNLLRALELRPPAKASVDPVLRAELTEGRDLLEHWPENLPVFNVTPRDKQPGYPSGKAFAARNPDRGPYDWLSFSPSTGAKLLPNVPASEVHQLIDALEDEVVGNDPTLSRYLPARAPCPWFQEGGRWWPKAP